MSVEMMGLVFRHGPTDATQRFVLLSIADHADDRGRAFPGIALLAAKSCQSERNVMRVIQMLEVGGWVSVSRRAFGVKLKGNVYQMNVAKLAQPAKTPVRAPESSGDTVSLRLADDAANAEDSKPSGDMVSCDEKGAGSGDIEASSGDKTGVHQVTKSTPSGDKSCIPFNCINHQEPPKNQKDLTPQPPAEARGAVAHISDAEAGPRNAEEEAAERVMRECHLSNRRLRPVIARAIAVYRLGKTESPGDVAELMIESRAEFAKVGPYLRHSVSVRKFFGEGYWIDPRLWPVDRGRLPVGVLNCASNARREAEKAREKAEESAKLLAFWREVKRDNRPIWKDAPLWVKSELDGESGATVGT